MMIEFKKAFSNLPLNDKRNEISNELLLIGEIIRNYQAFLGIENIDFDIKNYDVSNDNTLLEHEMLDFLYEDIYTIKKELLVLVQKLYNIEK